MIGLTPGMHAQRDDGLIVGLARDYFDAVFGAGGLPVMLPLAQQSGELAALLEQVDGLLFTGGPDPDPCYWGEQPHPGLGRIDPERDGMELELARLALDRGTPVLGICRGAQMLAVARGGSLWQDITSQVQGAIQHRQNAPRHYLFHDVTITPGTRVAAATGDRSVIRVNSFHHQAVREVPPGFVISGVTADRVIEAFEATGPGFAVGVQWHPESIAAAGGEDGLFRALVQASQRR